MGAASALRAVYAPIAERHVCCFVFFPSSCSWFVSWTCSHSSVCCSCFFFSFNSFSCFICHRIPTFFQIVQFLFCTTFFTITAALHPWSYKFVCDTRANHCPCQLKTFAVVEVLLYTPTGTLCSDLHWCARVNFLHLGCWMCRDLVYDDVLQRDEQFFVWQCGATESIVQLTLKHQLFHSKSLFFVSDFPKPWFVLVRLVDEVLEDVIKLLHVFYTITFADVTDQRCIRRASE